MSLKKGTLFSVFCGVCVMRDSRFLLGILFLSHAFSKKSGGTLFSAFRGA